MTGTNITNFLEQGTAASRPAAPDAQTDTISFYFATDTEVLSFYDWNDAAWQDVTTGGSVPTAASTTEILTGTDTAKFGTPDSIAALWEKGGDTASAGTISVGEGGFFHITGTTTITDIDFGTTKSGRTVFLCFDGALTLTHNATTLILPTGANITTEAGDVAIFVSEGGDNVRCVVYQRNDGEALVGGGGGGPTGEETLVSPDISDYSWVNQDSATVTANSGGGLTIQQPAGTAAGVHAMVRSAPGATFGVKVKISPSMFNSNFQEVGLILRESGTGKLVECGFQNNRLAFIFGFANPDTFSTSYLVSSIWGSDLPNWFQAVVDGINIVFSVSCDGNVWDQIFSMSQTATFTTGPDEVGWGVQDRGGVYSVSCCLQSLEFF